MPNTISVPTSEGDAVATRVGRDASTGQFEWQVGYPWSDGRFYGNSSQVRADMRRVIAAHEAEKKPAKRSHKRKPTPA